MYAAAVRFDLHIPAESIAEGEARRDPPDRRRTPPPVPGLGRRGRPPRPMAARRDRGGGGRGAPRRSCGKCSTRSSGSSSRPPTSSCSTSRPRGSRANGRERMTSPKRYPRTARVNEVMLEVLADELERMSDPRLELVTLTGVDVSRDLAHAKVYYSTLTATAVDARGSDPRGSGDRVEVRGLAPARRRRAPDAYSPGAEAHVPRRSRHRLGPAHRGPPARDPPPRHGDGRDGDGAGDEEGS